MERSKIAQFVSIVLKVMFVAGVICLFFVPIIYDFFSSFQIPTFSELNIYSRLTFYLCSIGGLAIVFLVIRIFNDVYKSSPFKKETVINLKMIAVIFMALSIILAIKTIFLPTVISAIVSFVTFMASLAFYVLSQVFKVAVEYKDEVDHTV